MLRQYSFSQRDGHRLSAALKTLATPPSTAAACRRFSVPPRPPCQPCASQGAPAQHARQPSMHETAAAGKAVFARKSIFSYRDSSTKVQVCTMALQHERAGFRWTPSAWTCRLACQRPSWRVLPDAAGGLAPPGKGLPAEAPATAGLQGGGGRLPLAGRGRAAESAGCWRGLGGKAERCRQNGPGRPWLEAGSALAEACRRAATSRSSGQSARRDAS